MKDENKTKKELINELTELRKQIAELEVLETKRRRAEEALKKSEEKYHMLVENAPSVLWKTSEKGITVFISPNIKEVYGYTPEEIYADGYNSWLARIHHDDLQETVNSFQALFGKRKKFEVEYRIKRKDGKWIWARDVASVVREENGERYAYGVFTDITERKRAEEALYLDESRLEALLKLNQMADVSLKELANFVIEKVIKLTKSKICNIGFMVGGNEEVLKIYAYSKGVMKQYHAIDKDPVLTVDKTALLAELVQKRKPIVVNNYNTYPDKRLPEGHVPIVRYMVVPVLNDKKKIVAAAIVANKDEDYDKSDVRQLTLLMDGMWEIIQRKQSEEAVKRSEERYQNLIEYANVGIIVSEDEKIIQVNKEAEEIYGYSRGELVGKSAGILTPEKHKKKHRELLKEIIDLGEMKKAVFEEEGIRKDGTLFPVEISFSLAQAGGNTIIAVMRDISERKEMEHKLLQSEKLKSLGELAGGVAHDFNNVLAAILGRTQLLKMDVKAPPGIEERRKSTQGLINELDIMEKAAKDGAETVRRIQEFARVREDDKYFTQVDLNETVEDALDFTRSKWKDNAESNGIDINIQKELSPLPLISGSASELREVFTNSITNAVDAMPEGGTITIKTIREDNSILIKVGDTGVGISADRKGRIFDPFFTTKGVKSTGLGMSVSYGIINRHRGTISVDSMEGEGTTFTIRIPISEKAVVEEKDELMPAKQRKARILVIEDEEEVRSLFSTILERGEHEIEIASDGREGIEIFKNKEFDLVFTDLGMPGMSGWQVAEKIKGINSKTPVVLITGWDIKLKEVGTGKTGVDLIVHKPFEIKQVLNVVQEGMILRDRFNKAV